jgi:intracellular septation protein A
VLQGLAESFYRHPWAWWAIVGLGAYHGLNPGMGWLFAVSNGMQERRPGGVFLALPPIALGHFLAMAAALLPFTLFWLYLEKLGEIRALAGLLLVIFGVYKLVSQRHPRFLARIGPSHLALWSFLMATAHGAGLMLVPVVLGICTDARAARGGHQAMLVLAGDSVGLSFVAVAVHTAAMVLTGGAIAWLVYRYLGLGLLRRAWLNLDLIWAVLLIVVGAIALAVTFWE